MKSTQSLLTALVLFLLSLTAFLGARLLNISGSNILGITSTGVPCSAITNLQRQYCSNIIPSAYPSIPIPTVRVSTPTPLPQTNYLNVISQKCLPNGNLSAIINGNAVLLKNPSGYWMTITDNLSGITIIRGWTSGSGYYNPVNDNPSDIVWDTKNPKSFPLIGDGRTFTYSIYEGPYSSNNPPLNSSNFLASTTFGNLRCPISISTTPKPLSPTPTTSPSNYIYIKNIGCTGSYISGEMTGSFVMTTTPYDYWYTITNTRTGQRNIVVYAKGVYGTNSAHLTFYNPFSDIRGGPSMYLVGDGTVYTFAIYQSPYTSGIPNLINPITQTQFSKVCN